MADKNIHNGAGLSDRTRRFEAATLPHLGVAYNLALWLLRDEQNAQDVVQDAYLRALRFFDGLRGEDARPWLLSIVRNACFTWLKDNKREGEHVEFEEDRDSDIADLNMYRAENNPENLLIIKMESAQINQAISALSPVFREVIILRELEELSYEEIALVASIPLGTVMSRLARARALLRSALKQIKQEVR